MSENDLPTWISVGEKVAEYSNYASRHGNVRVTTVERLTTTQVVLSNQNRYRRSDLRQVGNLHDRRELAPLDDPGVRRALAHATLRGLLTKVGALVNGVGDDIDDVLATLAEIQAATIAARTRVSRLAGQP